jgi:hypothetical protein
MTPDPLAAPAHDGDRGSPCSATCAGCAALLDSRAVRPPHEPPEVAGIIAAAGARLAEQLVARPTLLAALSDPRARAGTHWIRRPGIWWLLRINPGRDEIEWDSNCRWNDGAERWEAWSIKPSDFDIPVEIIPAMSEDEFDARPRDDEDDNA